MKAHPRRATLRDIAQDVGVSTGTVSVVLNGARSGTSVADRTREAIHASAKRLRYRPNWVAKSLQGGRTRTIGIIPTQAVEDFLRGPYIQRVLNAVANVLAAEHHDLLLLTRCDQSDVQGILQAVVNGRIDGAIVVAPRADSRLVETLDEAGFPFVVIDGVPVGHATSFDVDDAAGTRLGLAHLRELGHERIAYVAGPQSLASGVIRLEAFREAWSLPESLSPPGERGVHRGMHSGAIQVDGSEGRALAEPIVIPGDYMMASGRAALETILTLDPRPTAVLCANDEMAAGVMRAARERGVAVPDELSVVGFDDSPNAVDLQPSLTTYAQPTEKVAEAAAKAILATLDDFQPVRGDRFAGHFVIRESTTRPKKDL